MMTYGFVVGDLAPFRGADVVLGVDERVADEADVGHDAHEFFGGHGGPDVPVYLGVVDLFDCVSRLDIISSCLFSGDGEVAANHQGWSEYGS